MPNDDAKLFVAGLPDSISEEILKQLFESTGGKVVDVRLPKEAETGRPRGFGFVTFSSPAEATSAREALDGTIQSGRSISVRPCLAEPPKRDGAVRPGSSAGPPSRAAPQSPDKTLYVGNLPYDCTTQEIETLVAGVIGDKGTVVRVHLPVDPDGCERGGGGSQWKRHARPATRREPRPPEGRSPCGRRRRSAWKLPQRSARRQ